MIECQHGKSVTEGCPECYHDTPNRAIYDDVCEIVRMTLGATNHGPDREAGTPLFRRVMKTPDEIESTIDEIIMICERMKDEL